MHFSPNGDMDNVKEINFGHFAQAFSALKSDLVPLVFLLCNVGFIIVKYKAVDCMMQSFVVEICRL